MQSTYGFFKVVPDRNSLMINRIEANENDLGHSAWIFTDITNLPPIEEFGVPLESDTVYFVTVPESTSFPAFNVLYDLCLMLPIHLYLLILEYFKHDWPKIHTAFITMIDQMQSRSMPVMIEPSLYFYMDGEVEHVIDIKDAKIVTRIDSKNESRRFNMEISRHGITIEINPNVMQQLSKNLVTLAKIHHYDLRVPAGSV